MGRRRPRLPRYLVRNPNGTYCLRRDIPRDLREAAGCRRIVRSLGTRDLAEALVRFKPEAARMSRWLAEVSATGRRSADYPRDALGAPPRRRFTSAEDAAPIADRYLCGESVAGIASSLGCDVTSVRKALQIAGVAYRSRGLGADPAALEQILNRRAQGETCAAIASDYGVARQTIWLLCRRHHVGAGDKRTAPGVEAR